MSNGIPSDAVGASVGVLVYSVICWFLCTILVGLLITFGEKLSYVTLHSCFTSLSTLASIIQQVFFAAEWRTIKEAHFNKAIRAISLPGLTFVGGANTVDMTLFFIQFWCYNTMALNIFFWSVDLFTSSWGFRTPWLGSWLPRIGPISKVFSVIFPGLIIGLMNAEFLLKSGVATFIVTNGTIFLTLSTGSILLVLILYKYMKTRRLATGGSRRGAWWASRDSKSQQSRDVGSNYTPGTANLSTRSSIYDRALITRFSIGFVVLAFFLAAIVVFSYISSTTNKSIATAGRPDFSTSGAITDILLFMPGVTASLVTFLVFGTAKSWRQYRDLLIGGCGIRNRFIQRKFLRQREEQETQVRAAGVEETSIEFTNLPPLKTTRSFQERVRDEEAMKRVQMFAREVGNGHTPSSSRDTTISGEMLVLNAQLPARDTILSYHQREVMKPDVPTGKLAFHRPRPSLLAGGRGSSGLSEGSREIQMGLERDAETGERSVEFDQLVIEGKRETTRSPLTMNGVATRVDEDLERGRGRAPRRESYWAADGTSSVYLSENDGTGSRYSSTVRNEKM